MTWSATGLPMMAFIIRDQPRLFLYPSQCVFHMGHDSEHRGLNKTN